MSTETHWQAPATRYERTDGSYLADPAPRMRSDWPSALLRAIGAWSAHVADRATDLFPTMMEGDDIDQGDACAIAAAVIIGDLSPDSPYLDRLSVRRRAEWPTVDMVAATLENETLADGGATSPAPRPFNTTVGHAATTAGEYKTHRHHMTVVDSSGTVAGTYDLLRRANALLRTDGFDLDSAGNRGHLEDMSYPEQGPTVRTETIEGVTLNGAPMVRAWSVTPGLVVGSQYKPSGALRKSTPSGRPHRVTVVGYAAKTNTHDRDKLTCVGSVGRWETLDANGCLPIGAMPYCSTAPVYAVTIKHGGRTMVGHGPWSAKKVRAQGQTRAEQRTRSVARKAKVAAITHQALSDAEAIHAAIALSHSLAESTATSETVQTGSTAPAPRPTTDSVKIALTHRDIVVTIGKAKGRPFRVTIVHGKVRHQTTSTAPDYVGRVLANRLAVIG